MIQIGVIGSRESTATQEQWAEEIGVFIARYPAILVCGGMGGVMKSAAKGALEAGGLTVGILPGDDASDANEYITVRIPTGMGISRNALVARSCRLIFAIGGGAGTLSEIAHATQLGVPVVGLDTWKEPPGIFHAANVREACAKADALLKEMKT